MHIDTDIPGGNIVVDEIDTDIVRLHQDLRDTTTDWFYWHFRVRGAAGRTLTFVFTGDLAPIGQNGPSVSTDGGATYTWLGADTVEEDRQFRYTFAHDVDEVRFGFAIPYTEKNLRDFLARHEDDSRLRVETHCQSRKGRTVERIHVGCLTSPAHCIFLTSRHHCCEMMATWAMEGLLDAVLGSDSLADWYRAQCEVIAVPFMDKDGTEEGDQGKNRAPYDHNRDYGEGPIYPEVRATMAYVAALRGNGLDAALDLHCPWIRGNNSEKVYQVGKQDPAQWARQQAFGQILEQSITGSLPYAQANDLPFGEAWNTGATYAGGKTNCGSWMGTVPGIRLATSFEIPYSYAQGATVTAETARAFGRDLATALRRFLTACESA